MLLYDNQELAENTKMEMDDLDIAMAIFLEDEESESSENEKARLEESALFKKPIFRGSIE